jgi:outer membrane protein assembly factor BamB
MTIDQLVFVGLNGYALALHRDTGEIVWSNNDLKYGAVTLLLDGDRLIVSTGGYMFCLDPLTGESRWSNPLTGYRMPAPAALLSVRGQSSQPLAHAPDTDDSVTTAAIAAGVIASTSGS